MEIKTISHTIDDNGTMTIFVDNMSVAEISDCDGLDDNQKEALITEVLNDLEYDV